MTKQLLLVLLSDLSGCAVCGIGTVVKLSVKLSGVKIQHKLPQLAGDTAKNKEKNTCRNSEGSLI